MVKEMHNYIELRAYFVLFALFYMGCGSDENPVSPAKSSSQNEIEQKDIEKEFSLENPNKKQVHALRKPGTPTRIEPPPSSSSLAVPQDDGSGISTGGGLGGDLGGAGSIDSVHEPPHHNHTNTVHHASRGRNSFLASPALSKKRSNNNPYRDNTYQMSAVRAIEKIVHGVKFSQPSAIFAGIDILSQKIIIMNVTNPYMIAYRLLESLTTSDAEWLDDGLKRLIVQQARRFINATLWLQMETRQSIDSKSKENMEEAINTIRSLSGKESIHHSGVEFEITCIEIVLAGLKDTGSWGAEVGKPLKGLVKIVTLDGVCDGVTELLSGLGEMASKASKLGKFKWYIDVLEIEALKNTALNTKIGIKVEERVAYIGKIKSIINGSRNWQVKYAGISALGEIVVKAGSQQQWLAAQAFFRNGVGGSEPLGLGDLLHFDRFLSTSDWQVRAVAAQEAIKIAALNDRVFAPSAKKMLAELYVQELDRRVIRVLKNSVSVGQLNGGIKAAARKRKRKDKERQLLREQRNEREVYKLKLRKLNMQHRQQVSSYIQAGWSESIQAGWSGSMTGQHSSEQSQIFSLQLDEIVNASKPKPKNKWRLFGKSNSKPKNDAVLPRLKTVEKD
ncbi:MAG: hypothetical protein AAF320_02845 [Myxococcota bacterium]